MIIYANILNTMHPLKIFSIILLILGALTFSGGLWLYWITNPISGWASAFIMTGILFLLEAIVLLCVVQQYELPPLSERLRTPVQY